MRNISSVREEEKKENNNDKSKDIFGDLNIKPEKSINNIPLFTSNKNNGNNLEEQNKNNERLQIILNLQIIYSAQDKQIKKIYLLLVILILKIKIRTKKEMIIIQTKIFLISIIMIT